MSNARLKRKTKKGRIIPFLFPALTALGLILGGVSAINRAVKSKGKGIGSWEKFFFDATNTSKPASSLESTTNSLLDGSMARRKFKLWGAEGKETGRTSSNSRVEDSFANSLVACQPALETEVSSRAPDTQLIRHCFTNLKPTRLRVSESEISAAPKIEVLRADKCDCGDYGASLERKGGANGRSLRKPANQRHRQARFLHAKIRSDPAGNEPGSPWWEASRLTTQPLGHSLLPTYFLPKPNDIHGTASDDGKRSEMPHPSQQSKNAKGLPNAFDKPRPSVGSIKRQARVAVGYYSRSVDYELCSRFQKEIKKKHEHLFVGRNPGKSDNVVRGAGSGDGGRYREAQRGVFTAETHDGAAATWWPGHEDVFGRRRRVIPAVNTEISCSQHSAEVEGSRRGRGNTSVVSFFDDSQVCTTAVSVKHGEILRFTDEYAGGSNEQGSAITDDTTSDSIMARRHSPAHDVEINSPVDGINRLYLTYRSENMLTRSLSSHKRSGEFTALKATATPFQEFVDFGNVESSVSLTDYDSMTCEKRGPSVLEYKRQNYKLQNSNFAMRSFSQRQSYDHTKLAKECWMAVT
ncbi:hypothetical protein PR048_026683 [Dryococelus australis]|uniref:Transmembrane protein n=1 Tax=Dryococelus australis TaxID=614101 RepID=A0ABQ9GM32_9NEOP|nr:hypothetical protein PR048_026683 [Dryococelus australis]